jgi:hypothetical protein
MEGDSRLISNNKKINRIIRQQQQQQQQQQQELNWSIATTDRVKLVNSNYRSIASTAATAAAASNTATEQQDRKR